MRRSVSLLLFALSACAPDLRTDFPFDGTGATCIDPETKKSVDCAAIPLVFARVEGEQRTLIVDATNKEVHVYVDLDEGREMKLDEALTTNAWDLSFKRFEILANGGATNPEGQVEIAVIEGGDYDGTSAAPSDGFVQDGADSVFTAVNGGWYYYDLGVHRLITKDLLYVIRSSAGAYFKLRMGSYYDDAGTPARLSLTYASVAAP
ncbi:MAG: HmuY family protein [Archangium sp.]|nr:HmuY family protein [Archangium sp.]